MDNLWNWQKKCFLVFEHLTVGNANLLNEIQLPLEIDHTYPAGVVTLLFEFI